MKNLYLIWLLSFIFPVIAMVKVQGRRLQGTYSEFNREMTLAERVSQGLYALAGHVTY